MSAPGKPIDNPAAKAFFKTLKTELILPNRQLTKAQMEVLLRRFLDDYYPNQRIHTTFGMPPVQYEQQLFSQTVTNCMSEKGWYFQPEAVESVKSYVQSLVSPSRLSYWKSISR